MLNLTLKKKWFDLISSGQKKAEYREIKPYWIRRLIQYDSFVSPEDYYPEELCMEFVKFPDDHITTMKIFGCKFKRFTTVSANNGYKKDCPNIKWIHHNITIGKPNPEWCEPGDVDKIVFILSIGNIIKY